MSLSVGIVGLPNVGKSTLFNAMLKKQQALVANYPFATVDPNVGVVPVPDSRLDQLAQVVASENAGHLRGEYPLTSEEALVRMRKEGPPVRLELPPIVPATVQFTDIAGLVKGASEGEGLGNQFLAHIRETALICLVVRAFTDAEVTLTGSGDPKTDMETIITELILADLKSIEAQSSKLKGQNQNVKLKTILDKLLAGMNQGRMAREVLSPEEQDEVRDLFLLTMKQILYVINVDEAELAVMTEEALTVQYGHILQVKPEEIVIVSAKIEAELSTLRQLEQAQYLATLGMTKSGLERLIIRAYQQLGLVSFLTAGEKEVRAWTIRRGDTALMASAVIHTDFAKHFIKADVVQFDEFVRVGGWKKARENGLVRSEGRDYIMQDGDLVEFKIGT